MLTDVNIDNNEDYYDEEEMDKEKDTKENVAEEEKENDDNELEKLCQSNLGKTKRKENRQFCATLKITNIVTKVIFKCLGTVKKARHTPHTEQLIISDRNLNRYFRSIL